MNKLGPHNCGKNGDDTKLTVDTASQSLSDFIDCQYCFVCLQPDIVLRVVIIISSLRARLAGWVRPNWTGKLLTIIITGYIDRIIRTPPHLIKLK